METSFFFTGKIGVFLIVALYCSQLQAQSSSPPSLDYYISKAREFSYKNNDSLIFYGRKMQEVASNDCIKADGLLVEAKAYYQMLDYEVATKLVNKAIELSKDRAELCHKQNMVSSYLRLFYIAKNDDKFDVALDHLLERKRILESLSVRNNYYIRNIIHVKSDIATLKIQLGAYKEALDILKNSNQEIESVDIMDVAEERRRAFSLQKANMLNTTGNVYVSLNEKHKNTMYLDSAEIYYEKAYKIANSISNPNPDTEAIYRMRQIKILFAKEDYELTHFYLNRYDSMIRRFNYLDNTHNFIRGMTFRYIQENDSAIYYSKKYLEYYESKGLMNINTIRTYDNLAHVYESLSENDSALKYSNLTLEKLREFEKNKQSTILRIHSSEMDEFKELNNVLLRRNSRSNLYIYIILIVSTILLLFIRYKTRKKDQPSPNAAVRSLDKQIEAKILEGIMKFEKTDLFLDSDFNIQSLANYLETNSTYISIVINSHKKKSFKHYISELRIQHVIDRLKKDKKFAKYSIAAIAEEVGYTNASAFTRMFKKQTGKTPSEYIRSLNS